MASIKNDHLLNGISGKIGEKLVVKTYGRRTILSRKSSAPENRSPAQKANAEKFRLASRECKSMLRNPEINDYFKRIAREREQASPYTAAMKNYLTDPTLFTQAYLLEQARKPVIIDEPKTDGTMDVEVKVVTSKGDVIAQGFASQTDKGSWKYKAPITDLAVIITFKHQKDQH